jgi:ParB-like chromosome segregation protein Spo0J
LNDAKEMLLTADLTAEALDSVASRKSTSPRDRAICAELREFARWLDTPQRVYIFSLSERADTLSQWRAYGQPGSSYALGFSTALLQRAATAHGLELCKCIYDRRRQLAYVRALVRFAIQRVRSFMTDKHDRNSRFGIHLDFVVMLLILGQYLKHPDFAEEQEWRLVLTRPKRNQVEQFGGKGSLLAPFMNSHWTNASP